MKKMALTVGILCIVVAVVIFVFASGLRRWYSGLFFAFLGIVSLLNAARWHRETE
jgi:uncharacterized membrane protein